MLHKTSPRPSLGALRVLRQLALYGSFGTAAGSAAFLLEEQRRQICRLSKMAENGRRIKEFMRHAHSNAPVQQQSGTGTADFARYVQNMEVQGLVTREANSKSQELDEREKEQGDHYFTNVHDHPRRRRRRHGNPVALLHDVEPAAAVQRGEKYSPHKNGLSTRPPRLSAPTPAIARDLSWADSPTNLETKPRRAARSRSRNWGLWRRSPVHRLAIGQLRSDPTLDAYRLEIANRFNGMDHGAFEDYLAAKISHGDFEPLKHLLDACKAELPWSKPLYPVLLRSLARVDKAAYLIPEQAIQVLSMCRRIMTEGELNPVASLMDLYQARAFQLVIDTYRTLPQEKSWSRVELSLLLESALEVLDAGSIDSGPLTRILRQLSKEPGFATHVLPVLEYKVKGEMVFPVLDAFSIACCSSTDPRSLNYLEHLLSAYRSLDPVVDEELVNNFRDVLYTTVQEVACSDLWFSRMHSVYLAHQRSLRAAGCPTYRRYFTILNTALNHGFHGSLLDAFQEQPNFGRLGGIYEEIGKSYLSLGQAHIADIDAVYLNRIIGLCYKRGLYKVVVALFREFHRGGVLTAGTTTCCWDALLIHASNEEFVAFLRELLKDEGNSIFMIAIEHAQARFIRRTWVRTRDFKQVSTFYNTLTEMTTLYNATHDVKLLNGQVINAMLSVCAKTRDLEAAERYAKMLVASQSQPSEAAVPHFALIHAKLRNWSKVENLVDSVKRRDKMEVFGGDFFADLFHVYCEQHTSDDAYAFFRRCLYDWGVAPDPLMVDNLIAACMGGKGDLRVVRRLLHTLEHKGVHWQIRPKTVIMAYQHYARQWRPDGPVAVQLLQTWNQHYRGLISKNLCLQVLETCSMAARAYDVKGKSSERHAIASVLRKKLLHQVRAIERIASSAPWLSERSSSNLLPHDDWVGVSNADKAPMEASQTFYSQMQIAFSSANYEQVVAIYKDFNSQNLPRLRFALDLAVISCLRLGDEVIAHALIRQAATAGQPIHNAQRSMLIHALSRPDAPFQQLAHLRIHVQKAYTRMERNNEPLRHDLLVAAAHHLTTKDSPDLAISLIADAYGSRFEPLQPFDIVVMSAWVAAYGKSLNLAGVRWVIKKILKQNMLIDLHFFKTLHFARNECVQGMRATGDHHAANKAAALFQVYDALIWRRYQTQRIQGNAIGRRMVAALVDLRNLNDHSIDRAHSRPATDFRKRMLRNSRDSIKRRARLLIGRRAKLAADIMVRRRREKVMRRKADRIKAWADREGAEADKMERGVWRKMPVRPVEDKGRDLRDGRMEKTPAWEEFGLDTSGEVPGDDTSSQRSEFALSAFSTWDGMDSQQLQEDIASTAANRRSIARDSAYASARENALFDSVFSSSLATSPAGVHNGADAAGDALSELEVSLAREGKLPKLKRSKKAARQRDSEEITVNTDSKVSPPDSLFSRPQPATPLSTTASSEQTQQEKHMDALSAYEETLTREQEHSPKRTKKKARLSRQRDLVPTVVDVEAVWPVHSAAATTYPTTTPKRTPQETEKDGERDALSALENPTTTPERTPQGMEKDGQGDALSALEEVLSREKEGDKADRRRKKGKSRRG